MLLGYSALALCALTTGATFQTPTFGSWGVDTSTLSSSVKPGDDFYTYVDEGWLKRTKVPEGAIDFGAFDPVARQNTEWVKEIILAAVSGKEASPAGRQLQSLYAAYVDTARLDHMGLMPIESDLKSILGIKDLDQVAEWMGNPVSSSIVGIYVFTDFGNTRRNVVWLDQQIVDQPILGLPNRSEYTGADAKSVSDRAAYRNYIEKTLTMAGVDRASERADQVISLETKLAPLQWDLNQLADRKANYHLMKRTELGAYAPGFPWDSFLRARGVDHVDDVVLATDSAVRAYAAVFAQTPVNVWSSYLAFHLISNLAEYLPTRFWDASWQFYQHTLNGQTARGSREQDGVGFVGGKLGMDVGRLYVAHHFPEATRQGAVELFEYLRRGFEESIQQADWLDEPTKAEALMKLSAFKIKVGYPTPWPALPQAGLTRTDLLGDVIRLYEEGWKRQVKRLDHQEKTPGWYQTPQTTNASFNPPGNAIELPAGLLFPPFFDPKADPAVNFGSIGAIIGHEMGHGFDSQGSKFDEHGQLRDWWTPESHLRFESRTKTLVDQYSAYSPLKGVFLDGKRTLNENIGDLTGVSVAFRAYHLYLQDHGGAAPVLDGFTGDQRFFLSWAQSWRYVAPDSAFKWLAENSYHSPAPYRVNGVVRNVDGWYKAFNVTPADKLFIPLEKRVHIW